jgi:hypothetical protein
VTSPITAGQGTATLGSYTFRINPSQVFFSYDMDTKVIPTIGGRVVQVYGCTLGDMTIQGLFGEERTGAMRQSWQLAEEFATAIGQMVVQQSVPPSVAQLAGTDSTPMHQPFRFLFNDDTPERRAAGMPVHNWDLNVYIKGLKDAKGEFTVSHETGKFSYGYQLTLFIVEDNAGTLIQGITDDFISRLADGVGWQQSAFNGPMTIADVQSYLAGASPDGTLHSLIQKELSEKSLAFTNMQAQLAGTSAAGAPTGDTAAGTAVGAAGNAGNVAGPTPGGSKAPSGASLSKLDPKDPGYAQAVADYILSHPQG